MAKKRKRETRNINWELPSSIMEVIFSKLPFYIFPTCRIVCKQWNHLISNSKFDSQISNYSLFFDDRSEYLVCVDFDPNPLEGMSSVASFNFHPKFFSGNRVFSVCNYCNGLLCLLTEKFSEIDYRTTHSAVCILNPMTNEYFKLPISKGERSNQWYRYALGFSPRTKQYKIVRASEELDRTRLEIFAFRTRREWVTVGFLPALWNSNVIVYSNGGFYLVKDYGFVHRLDVEDETIRAIPSPIDKGIFWEIKDLNGSLYQVSCTYGNFFHGWKMREDFSWIKAFAFYGGSMKPTEFKFVQIMRAYEDGKILFNYGDYELMLYDPMSKRTEILADQDGEVKKMATYHQVSSPNFNSLPKILAGNG